MTRLKEAPSASKPSDHFPADAAGDYHRQRLADGAACLEWAIRYRLKFDLPVLALCPPDHAGVGKKHLKECLSPGKVPWHPWKQYQVDLPAEAEVRGWWRQLPTSNCGMALGRHCRVDVDGKAGLERLRQVSGDDLPITWRFRRGEASLGILFLLPEGSAYRTHAQPQEGAHQELRFQALGAQTVLPPSRHKDGDLYQWVPGHAPWEVAVAPAPAWLLEQLGGPAASGAGPRRTTRLAAGQVFEEGRRNGTLFRVACRLRHYGHTESEILALLLVMNDERCTPPLGEGEVQKFVASACKYPPGQVPVLLWGRRRKHGPITVCTRGEVG
jgi:hypothetical protein